MFIEKRRMFLKGGVAAGVVSAALGAGLLAPRAVLAEWKESAFKAKAVGDALKDMLGSAEAAESGDIVFKSTPEIAENGAVVPVTVESTLPAVESITLLVKGNATPLVAVFELPGAEAYVATRIKMGKTSDVVAVVKSGGKLYQAAKEVKVTIGGCGG